MNPDAHCPPHTPYEVQARKHASVSQPHSQCNDPLPSLKRSVESHTRASSPMMPREASAIDMSPHLLLASRQRTRTGWFVARSTHTDRRARPIVQTASAGHCRGRRLRARPSPFPPTDPPTDQPTDQPTVQRRASGVVRSADVTVRWIPERSPRRDEPAAAFSAMPGARTTTALPIQCSVAAAPSRRCCARLAHR